MSSAAPHKGARLELQRVATHVLARARFAADGRFGLRVTPGGFTTSSFGPEGNVLRVAGVALIRESRVSGTARSETVVLPGRTLRDLAAFAGVDLAPPFSVGADTPPLGDPDAPLELDVDAAREVTTWFETGAAAIDRVMPEASEPSVAQLWPEHFDVGIDVAVGQGRANLGASPGDADHPEPYLYVGPWGQDRPGDPTFWNAPFGAVLARSAVAAAPDPVARAAAFYRRGLQLLESG